MLVKKWKVTRNFFWHSLRRENIEMFIVTDEFGKQVCSGDTVRRAVLNAMRIAKEHQIAVEVVGD